MNNNLLWKETTLLCDKCKGCEVVADGEAGCLYEEEWIEKGDY